MKEERLGNCVDVQVLLEKDPSSHLVSVTQTVTVRAGPQYRGNVSCRASQEELSQVRRLTVVPLTARISSSQGLITLSLTTCCLILILAAGLVLLAVRRKEVKIESEARTQSAISYIDLYSELYQHPPSEQEEEQKHIRAAVSPPPAYRASPAYTMFHCQHSCFSHHLHLQQP